MLMGHEKESSKTSNVRSINSLKDSGDVSVLMSVLDNSVIRTNPFGANVSGDHSYQRAERICAALHLITNHVLESEPLRNAIRRSGIELLECILEMRVGLRAPTSEKGQAVLEVLRRLISLVRLLVVSGYISAQNATAVSDALDELGNLIVVSQKSGLAEQVALSREDLVPTATVLPIRPKRTSMPPASVQNPPKARVKDKPVSSSGELQAVSGDARADRILDILKMGGVLGIKDIALNLPQYSEKMIQRELAELVESGRVRKSGEKRWSRYNLVS